MRERLTLMGSGPVSAARGPTGADAEPNVGGGLNLTRYRESSGRPDAASILTPGPIVEAAETPRR